MQIFAIRSWFVKVLPNLHVRQPFRISLAAEMAPQSGAGNGYAQGAVVDERVTKVVPKRENW